MRGQFSIADLLSLTATFAVLFASSRWLGYDGAILATPFGGVVNEKGQRNGVKFEGTDGWIFVSRGNERVTGSDPVAKLKEDRKSVV